MQLELINEEILNNEGHISPSILSTIVYNIKRLPNINII